MTLQRSEMTSRDEQRAACIEAIAEAATISIRRATAAFDSLHGLALVNPVEATNHMLKNGALEISSETNWSDAMSCWTAMSAAGDLTNPQEKKP